MSQDNTDQERIDRNHIAELEHKIAFLERHAEELDKAFVAVNDQLRVLTEAVKRLNSQSRDKQGPGGTESLQDAVPPHHGS